MAHVNRTTTALQQFQITQTDSEFQERAIKALVRRLRKS
jgi:hypothetical protein